MCRQVSQIITDKKNIVFADDEGSATIGAGRGLLREATHKSNGLGTGGHNKMSTYQMRAKKMSSYYSSDDESGDTNTAGTIMVVDDSQVTRMFMGFVIEEIGFKVEYASDGAEAYKQLDEKSLLELGDIKLILTDGEMPNMNGFKLS